MFRILFLALGGALWYKSPSIRNSCSRTGGAGCQPEEETTLRWWFRESGTMRGLRPEQQNLRGQETATAPDQDGGFIAYAIPGAEQKKHQ